MNKADSYLKPLMPILSAVYGVAIIYITALPVAGDNPTFVDELLTWLITLAGIALTLFLVHRKLVFSHCWSIPTKKETINSNFRTDMPKFSADEVFVIMAEIPKGKVVTFGEIATLMGQPQTKIMRIFARVKTL